VLSVAEASQAILAHVAPLASERVALLDALGRVLAADIRSPVTLPAWDNSAMDGYAVRSADILGATVDRPIVLGVIETVPAGGFPSATVRVGEATRIMTGAPLPAGADTVVRVEDTDGGAERVAIRSDRDANHNVRPKGEDIRSGEVVLVAGQPIGPAQIGVLASVGAAHIDVRRQPRVAILGSGDELVDLDEFESVLAGRKIVSSNTYALVALVRDSNALPINLGIARDTPQSLRERLAGAAGCDLILTSAGLSVGEHDYLRDVLRDMGADMKFWRVRMRPGAPLGFGILGTTPWLGLPGNPVSTMVTYELFARPAIRRMLGHVQLFRRPVDVVLEEPVTVHVRLTHFLRGIVTTHADGTLTARLTGPQGSGIVTSMSLANALLVVPEDRTRVEPGEHLHALPLTDDATLTTRFAL
jgi:molybdopterin molybdotransferase